MAIRVLRIDRADGSEAIVTLSPQDYARIARHLNTDAQTVRATLRAGTAIQTMGAYYEPQGAQPCRP